MLFNQCNICTVFKALSIKGKCLKCMCAMCHGKHSSRHRRNDYVTFMFHRPRKAGA